MAFFDCGGVHSCCPPCRRAASRRQLGACTSDVHGHPGRLRDVAGARRSVHRRAPVYIHSSRWATSCGWPFSRQAARQHDGSNRRQRGTGSAAVARRVASRNSPPKAGTQGRDRRALQAPTSLARRAIPADTSTPSLYPRDGPASLPEARRGRRAPGRRAASRRCTPRRGWAGRPPGWPLAARTSPLSGPPLCSWPVECRKRGPYATVVATRKRSMNAVRSRGQGGVRRGCLLDECDDRQVPPWASAGGQVPRGPENRRQAGARRPRTRPAASSVRSLASCTSGWSNGLTPRMDPAIAVAICHRKNSAAEVVCVGQALSARRDVPPTRPSRRARRSHGSRRRPAAGRRTAGRRRRRPAGAAARRRPGRCPRHPCRCSRRRAARPTGRSCRCPATSPA